MTVAPARYSGRETPALERLREVSHTLGPLCERVVFIGGAIAPLLQTHPVSERIRPTKDVDGMAVTSSYTDFDSLQTELRNRGFSHRGIGDDPTRHAHRWTTPQGGLFDLVPAGEHLGASGSKWDRLTLDRAVDLDIAKDHSSSLVIRHADAPSFLMLKWAAFRDRGAEDFHGSHDVEDIFAVMASRPSLSSECEQVTEPDIRAALAQMARTLFADKNDFGDLLAGHIKLDVKGDVKVVYQMVTETVRALAHLDRADSE